MNERTLAASTTIKQSAKLSRWLRPKNEKITFAKCELKYFPSLAREHAVNCDRKHFQLLRAVCLWNISVLFFWSQGRWQAMEITYRICRHQAAWERLRDMAHNEWENESNRSSRHVVSGATIEALFRLLNCLKSTSLTRHHQQQVNNRNAINKSREYCNRRNNWTLKFYVNPTSDTNWSFFVSVISSACINNVASFRRRPTSRIMLRLLVLLWRIKFTRFKSRLLVT